MSVWSDIGFRPTGEPFGVDPRAFWQAAYSFWRSLRNQTGGDLPVFDFEFHRKRGADADFWFLCAVGNWLSFRSYTAPFTLGFPVPGSVWSAAPDWSTIFAQTEASILAEDVIPYPYDHNAPFRDVMFPRWPEQRVKIVQAARYVTVPVTIRRRYASSGDWTAWYYPFFDASITWGTGAYFNAVEATFPAYWAQAGARKVGVNGEAGKPISGDFWHSGEYFFEVSTNAVQELKICGAVDLATHPDFAQYFDIT